MVNKTAVFIIFAAMFAVSVGAAGLETGYSQFQNWIPIIIAAVLLSVMLTSAYYMLGVALNNAKVKGQALAEFYQAIGTVVLVVLIIGILTIFGTTLTSTKTMQISPSSISSVCNSPHLADSAIAFVNSKDPGPTSEICNQIIATANKRNSMTANLDYALAASYVIDANMTNQTLYNLNALYYVEGFLQWLRTFHSVTTFCMPVTCAIPFQGTYDAVQITATYMPYVGYIFNRVTNPPIEIMATALFYMYFVEMVVILLIMYGWPYMLAAGIILRTFFFTRRIGGLIIAFVLVALIITPMLVLLEYTSLGNSNVLCQYGPKGLEPGNQQGCVQIIGTNSIPSMQIKELPLQDSEISQAVTYQLNFFKFPNVAEILNYYDCYPAGDPGNGVRSYSSILGVEFGFSSYYLVPLAGAAFGILDTVSSAGGIFTGFTGTSIMTPPGYDCFLPKTMAKATLALFNAYGIMGVTGYIMNILNVLVSLSAVVGLSSLLGGDTNIIGLGRFV